MTKTVIFTIYKELPEDFDGYKEITNICIDTHKKLAEFHRFDYKIIDDFEIPNYVKIKLNTIKDARTPNNQFLPMNSFTDIIRNEFTIKLHEYYDRVIYLDSDFLVVSNNLLNNISYSNFAMANEILLDLDLKSNNSNYRYIRTSIQNYMHISNRSNINLISNIINDQKKHLFENNYTIKNHTDLGLGILENYKLEIDKIPNAAGFTQSMYIYFLLDQKCNPAAIYDTFHNCEVCGYNLCLSALNKDVYNMRLTKNKYLNIINRLI